MRSIYVDRLDDVGSAFGFTRHEQTQNALLPRSG